MTRTERSWMRDIVSAFAPEGGRGLSPLPDEVDYTTAFARIAREATRKAALGLRLAVILVALAPPLMGMGLCLFSQLLPQERTALLGRLLRHRWFAVRELTLLLKFAAAVALLGTDTVRERSGYDAVQAPLDTDSGIHRRLPVLVAGAPPPPQPIARAAGASTPAGPAVQSLLPPRDAG